jgi:glycosyltransferase involved in cell wall biosynthesis
VHQPMIEPPIKLTESNLPHILAEKKKMILHVGRFFSHLHTKKQDVLVEVFRQLLEKYPAETKDWELVLIGSVEDEKYYAVVKEAAKGLPIRLLQPNHSGLWQYYQMASIYWHATGFGSDEMNEPAKMEHFGISTVEAMSMGCVPVVIGQGGQVEVVGEKLKDLLWLTAEECINQTIRLIKDPQLRHQQAALAVEQSHQFGKEQFRNKLVKMI